MTFKNLSLLMLFITSWVLISSLVKFSWGKEPLVDHCANFHTQPHPFLCNEKMALLKAHSSDLALIDGVSLALARRIVAYVKENQHAQIQDINDVKGVGDKTLAKIERYFF